MPKIIHQETICCGFKRCPTVKVFEDGSIEISDDDAELGSVGTIKLTSEQAFRIAALVTEQKEF